MKHLFNYGMLAGCLLFTTQLSAQCPGNTPDFLSEVTPIGLDYTIDITHQSCLTNGAIDASLNEALPADVFIYRLVPGASAYQNITVAQLDMADAEPGTYIYAFVNFVANQADACEFTLLDNPCPGDYTGDGNINGADLVYFLGEFSEDVPCELCCGDFNSDGFVNSVDQDPFLAVFGTTCSPVLQPEQVASENRTKMANENLFQPITGNQAPNQLLAYPNPANDLVNLSLSGFPLTAENSTVQVVDISGRTVEQFTVNYLDNMLQLNLEYLTTGTYYIILNTPEKSYNQHLIVR